MGPCLCLESWPSLLVNIGLQKWGEIVSSHLIRNRRMNFPINKANMLCCSHAPFLTKHGDRCSHRWSLHDSSCHPHDADIHHFLSEYYYKYESMKSINRVREMRPLFVRRHPDFIQMRFSVTCNKTFHFGNSCLYQSH